MALILTNDDGIDAPGLVALQRAVDGDTVVVAPTSPQSACSHQVTVTRPLRVERRSEAAYAVDGTPADCVRVALAHLHPEADFVLSGINSGANLGADVYISGTVAAVREAAFLGTPAIAVSHLWKREREIDWERAARWTSQILEDLLARPAEPGTFWNVNLPNLEPGAPDPPVIFCDTCTQPHPVRFRAEGDTLQYTGVYADRPRRPGTDVDVCFSGSIAVSPLSL